MISNTGLVTAVFVHKQVCVSYRVLPEVLLPYVSSPEDRTHPLLVRRGFRRLERTSGRLLPSRARFSQVGSASCLH